MRRAFAATALLLVLGACTGAPMSKREGREFADRALQAAGVEVSGESRTEAEECGRTGLSGWSTTVSADDGSSIEICVHRRGDRVAFVRDVGPAGVGPLLSDEQFRRLEAFRYDPVRGRSEQLQDRLSVVAALVLGLVVAALTVNRRQLLPSARSS